MYLTLEQLVQEQTWGLDEANRKLAQARDLFCSLFNANPIPMALMGPEGDVFLNVNAEFLSYFGFQPK